MASAAAGRQHRSGDFKKRWDREAHCYADHVEELRRVLGPGKVLVAETQRLFWHRDEVFDEILKFAGLPPFSLKLPKVVSCKAERYKGTYAGCYSGASRARGRRAERRFPLVRGDAAATS